MLASRQVDHGLANEPFRLVDRALEQSQDQGIHSLLRSTSENLMPTAGLTLWPTRVAARHGSLAFCKGLDRCKEFVLL